MHSARTVAAYRPRTIQGMIQWGLTAAAVLAVFIFSVTIWSAGFGSARAADSKLALVIGNGGYQDAPLENPVNDAALIADNLKSLGFRVFRHIDLDQRGMRRAVSDFGLAVEEAGEQSVSLVYYAGHGVQIEGENYLIPVGAQIRHERDVPIEAVSANDILESLGHTRTSLNIVVLDACRNNPYARSFRSGSRGLARMDAPQGTLLAYSTSPGSTAADGRGRNSPYALSLASAMNQPGLSIEEVFKRTRIAVMERTDAEQVPWESSSLTGYFTFLEGAGAQPTAKAVPDDETVYWTSIAALGDPALFQSYLEQYPQGRFRPIAEARIASLEAGPAVPPPVAAPADPLVMPHAPRPSRPTQSSQPSQPSQPQPSQPQPSQPQPSLPADRLAFAQGEFKPVEVKGHTECGRISFRSVKFTSPTEGKGRWSHPEASGNIAFRIENGAASARMSGPLVVNAPDTVEVSGSDLLVKIRLTYTGGRCDLAFRMPDVIAR
ncbi:caspase family protein [Hwanghaeella grinnelliae]|uniref:Caspase family protein n=1 Tax=Hwanghaeella grinnelliae TaxID=2500179 RepID=A0A3S2VSI9_9PROT|nr:caspase family protein [Hwanghaeella grinnelliae]RVU39491.1 caspase family protein [Hwanghaeella grinnelliae]